MTKNYLHRLQKGVPFCDEILDADGTGFFFDSIPKLKHDELVILERIKPFKRLRRLVVFLSPFRDLWECFQVSTSFPPQASNRIQAAEGF